MLRGHIGRGQESRAESITLACYLLCAFIMSFRVPGWYSSKRYRLTEAWLNKLSVLLCQSLQLVFAILTNNYGQPPGELLYKRELCIAETPSSKPLTHPHTPY